MKRFICIVGLCWFLLFTGCDRTNLKTDETQDVETLAVMEQETAHNKREKPGLLCDDNGLNNSMFYQYITSGYARDSEVSHVIEWDVIYDDCEEHNKWIEEQTFNSVFRYDDWCIRTGFFKESGQWKVTFFTYHGFQREMTSIFHINHVNLTYDGDCDGVFSPTCFGVPNDHSAEITSFDETKKTVTLTFTSPEGETTEVYINYEKQCRCDENGTPLLNENGNTFLYQFEGDFIGTHYNELD